MSLGARPFSSRRLIRWRRRVARVFAAILAGDICNTLRFAYAIRRSLPLKAYERQRSLIGLQPEVRSHRRASIAILLVGGPADDFPQDRAAIGVARDGAVTQFIPSFASKELKDTLDRCERDLVFVMALSDRPAPDALLRLGALFDQQPSLVLAFCDHERRDGMGQLTAIFKPGWDPELQASGDYLGPGLLLRRSALPDDLTDLYDLLQRWAPSLPATAVKHLPEPLIESGGCWPSILEKRVALRQSNQPEAWPLVSIIIPTRDQRALLQACLDGVLHKTDYPAIEVILVDNESREKDTLDYLHSLATDPRVCVLRESGAFNFSRLNNRAAQIAKGDVLVLLNNDTEVIEPQWLKALVAEAVRSEVGVVGAQLLYPDGSLQHAGLSLGMGGNAWHLFAQQDPNEHAWTWYPRQVAAVTGACLAIRRQVYRDLGGLDEGFPVTFNDVDLCLRARSSGLRILYIPTARLIHHESKSRGLDVNFAKQLDIARCRRRLAHLHGEAVESDPFYNPNLTPGLGEPRLLRRRS